MIACMKLLQISSLSAALLQLIRQSRNRNIFADHHSQQMIHEVSGKLGDFCIILGFTEDQQLGAGFPHLLQDLIQTDAPINQGNSGGALIDTQGNLIGINTASFSTQDSYGIGFSVPVNLVTEVMNEIIMHGKVERGYLGISDSRIRSLNNQKGVTVEFIDPQGPAFGILKSGDVLTKVNSKEIVDAKQLIELVSKTKPVPTLRFEVLRNNKTIEESVTLALDKTSLD